MVTAINCLCRCFELTPVARQYDLSTVLEELSTKLLFLIAKSLWNIVGLMDSQTKMWGCNWAPVDVRRRAALPWKCWRRGLPTVSTAHGEDEACRAILICWPHWNTWREQHPPWMMGIPCPLLYSPLNGAIAVQNTRVKLLKLDEYLANEDAMVMQKQIHSYTHVLLSRAVLRRVNGRGSRDRFVDFNH